MEDWKRDQWDDFLQWLAGNVKRHYSVKEFAARVSREEWTVRDWCRRGRIYAQRSMTRCGPVTLWVISHNELQRYWREGLLPPDGRRNTGGLLDDAPTSAPAKLPRPKPKPLEEGAVLTVAADDAAGAASVGSPMRPVTP